MTSHAPPCLSSRERFLTPHPLVRSIPLPAADVYDLYSRIASPGHPSFLLESGTDSTGVARYSFFGSHPYLVFSGKGDRYDIRTAHSHVQKTGDPFRALMTLLESSPMTRPADLPPFFGGAVGFFSYDLFRQFEDLPHAAVDDLQLPDLEFLFVDLLASVDHHTRTLHLIFTPPLDRMLSESRDKLYREGRERLAELEAKLSVPPTELQFDRSPRLPVDIRADQSQAEYLDRVLACQSYIRAGDIYQANLSHRFTIDVSQIADGAVGVTSPLLYQSLRRVNPSPFSALVVFEDMAFVCSSPERMIRLQGQRADTRPLAGTRPRGRTRPDDQQLTEALLTNNKERAEHLMLVDLARNDLGRVCQYGTVHVDEFMSVERCSHVTHMVSNVTGVLRDNLCGFDLIRAMSPGGTITGVPKIRCMEIIEELEPVRRGPYTGSIGYLSWSGDMDLNLVIRTLLMTHNRGYVQVGAGIVADSDPGREYEETLHKAQALFQAIR